MTAILSSAPAPLAPGFATPALDAQRCFRAVLEAMSRPGRVQRVDIAMAPPAPLGLAAAALLLTLADADTPVRLDPAAARAADWLRFHAGCPLAAAPGEAAFVLASDGVPPALSALDAGTEEEPHASATLLLQVAALEEAAGGWRLSGPGIETTHALRVTGLPADFVKGWWAANEARFPRGVDVILCAGDRLAALPRSTRIEQGAR